MKNSIMKLMKLGCDCATCGCSHWFWTTAPVWVVIGMAIGYWCLGGSGDIGSVGSQ
tara:strand:- start:356 stop:523 length:168 start_codon:yes stop_codon:yes gene_type:complete